MSQKCPPGKQGFPPPLRGVYIYALAIFIASAMFYYRSHLPGSPSLHFSLQQNPVPTYEHAPIRTKRNLPSPLSSIMPPHIGPVHNFTVPHLVSYYEDELPDNRTRLYLVTAGIMMDYSQRNFSAAGCLVGADVYPATLFIGEVIHCVIPRRLRPGEKLVPVIHYDDVVKRAEKGPVRLTTRVWASLYPGDLSLLDDDITLRGNLSSSNPEHFRLARSAHRVGATDHFVKEEAKFKPRYQLCQMTMVAPNSDMIEDWANYHRRIGVDKVFIFDNGAELDLKKIFEGRPDVEVVNWPYHKSQVPAITAFLFMARSRCERVLMHDSDEYFMFGLGDGTSLTTGERPMIQYVKAAAERGFDHVLVMYITMANSGFLHRPKGPVPMNFVHRKAGQNFKWGKPICSSDAEDWEAALIHLCGYSHGEEVPLFQEGIKRWGQLKMEPEELDDPPYVLHFRERSWEEWIEKWDAGRISGKQVADNKAGRYTMDEPDEKFMTVRPEFEYKHFRDNIYSKVMKDGRMDEQIIVQTKKGKRCEMLYKIVGNSVKGPVREKCS